MTRTHTEVPFSAVAIGEEFLWGAYSIDECNWGKKRSSRTADYRPRILGKLFEDTHWGFWRQDELVFVKR